MASECQSKHSIPRKSDLAVADFNSHHLDTGATIMCFIQ